MGGGGVDRLFLLEDLLSGLESPFSRVAANFICKARVSGLGNSWGGGGQQRPLCALETKNGKTSTSFIGFPTIQTRGAYLIDSASFLTAITRVYWAGYMMQKKEVLYKHKRQLSSPGGCQPIVLDKDGVLRLLKTERACGITDLGQEQPGNFVILRGNIYG